MDYADSGDLHAQIVKASEIEAPFTERRILRWFAQTLLGLKYLHDQQILHRDLKTRNLLLKGGSLMICDFGNSVTLTESEFVGNRTVGTLQYLSPEICKYNLYSYAGDIWALGCILHELFTFRVPFDAPGVATLFEKIMFESAPAVPAFYSNALRRLSAQLLRREADQRPSCADVVGRPVLQEEISQMPETHRHKEWLLQPLSCLGHRQRRSLLDGAATTGSWSVQRELSSPKKGRPASVASTRSPSRFKQRTENGAQRNENGAYNRGDSHSARSRAQSSGESPSTRLRAPSPSVRAIIRRSSSPAFGNPSGEQFSRLPQYGDPMPRLPLQLKAVPPPLRRGGLGASPPLTPGAVSASRLLEASEVDGRGLPTAGAACAPRLAAA